MRPEEEAVAAMSRGTSSSQTMNEAGMRLKKGVMSRKCLFPFGAQVVGVVDMATSET